jgi:hypothetical protein
MDSVAAPGTATLYARGDHVHPSDTSRLALSGGTLTGRLFMANDPAVSAPLETATQRYVVSNMPGENKLINSDMRIDQRNNGAAVNNVAGRNYSADRWAGNTTATANIFSMQRLATGGPAGFPYFMRCTALANTTPGSADTYMLTQTIEADVVADMGFGAAGASAWSLQFWVRASVSGNYSGSVCNDAGTRSYPFSFAISTANTWQRIAIQNQAGDTAGTWVGSGAGLAMFLRFDLGSGATMRSTQGSWQAGNFIGVTSAQSIVATSGRTLDITAIKFETGAYCTPYVRQTIAKSLADCQRYYTSIGNQPIWSGATTTSQTFYTWAQFPVLMRAAPTLTVADGGVSGFPAGLPTTQNLSSLAFQALKTANATLATGFYVFSYKADAEL